MKKLFASSRSGCCRHDGTGLRRRHLQDRPFHTFPTFEVSHMGFSTQRGRFDKTTGTIVLDRAAKKGSVDLTIDVASLNMGFRSGTNTWR